MGDISARLASRRFLERPLRVNIKTARCPLDRISRRRIVERPGVTRPLHDHAMRREEQSRLQQRRGVVIIPHQRTQGAHFFFDQGTFLAMWKHRIQINDLRHVIRSARHQCASIAQTEAHTRRDRRGSLIVSGTSQSVFEQCSD